MHPRIASPHALFRVIYRHLRRAPGLAAGAAGAVAAAAVTAFGQVGRVKQVVRWDIRLVLGVAAAAGVIAAAVAAGVSAGAGPTVDTADHVAAATQQHAVHRATRAKAAAEQHATKQAPSHRSGNASTKQHHAAKDHAAKDHAAKAHAAKAHAVKDHGGKQRGARDHGARQHAASRHAARHQATRRHRNPTRPYLIYDSVTPSAIAAHKNVAAYATGNYAASPAQVAGHQSVMWIDVTGYDHAASVLDVEPGDATPSMAASWAWHRLKDRPSALARIYTMRSEWPAVRAAVVKLPAKMRSHVRYWIADPTGTPHIVPGSDATQWYWGSSYDISSATPRF